MKQIEPSPADILKRKPTTKARTLVEETCLPYEKYIAWSDYMKERRLLYAGAYICNLKFGFGVLKERLEWIAQKDCISPVGVYRYLAGLTKK